MIRRILALCLAVGLAAPGAAAQAPPVVNDAEVAKGIREAEDGDYDSALLTLDAAANRLAREGGRTADLTQAYVYSGIAYVAKNLLTAAQARFRDALTQSPDLRLSPGAFPPRVVELFEQARQELARSASGAKPTAAAPAPAAAPEKKAGGSRKALIFVGVGAAVAGGVGIALSQGGSDPRSRPPGRQSEMHNGVLNPGGDDHFTITARPGMLDATLTTTEPRARPRLSVTQGSTGGALVVQQTSAPTAQVSATVTAQVYVIHVENFGERVPMPYMLTINYP
jgi:hypothetical protein